MDTSKPRQAAYFRTGSDAEWRSLMSAAWMAVPNDIQKLVLAEHDDQPVKRAVEIMAAARIGQGVAIAALVNACKLAFTHLDQNDFLLSVIAKDINAALALAKVVA